MRDILAEIVEKKKDIVTNAKREMPLDEVKRSLVCGTFAMTHRFRERDWNLIAECKLQSPAKGRLCRRYSVTELARIYEDNGASMLSVQRSAYLFCARISSSMNTRFTRRGCSAQMPCC